MGACHSKGSATYITKGRNAQEASAGAGKIETANKVVENGGFSYEYEGRTYTYMQKNGKVYNVSDVSAIPEELPTTKSATELAETAASKGRNVKILSPQDIKDREEQRRKDREARAGIDYELGVGVPWGNAAYRKAARRSRLQTRVQRRKR